MLRATRTEALERLADFLPRAGREYRATRNEDRGPADRGNVSGLGPFIRARLVGDDEVIRAVLARHRLSSAEKFVAEVLWRSYWKGWLEARPAVWSAYRRSLDACYARLESDPPAAKAFREATAGRTGIQPFDVWVHELVETGYLHNHARMWFASIWIFTLRLPWELGADFFMRYLLCGDPASNTLSWRWVAGLHTKGKTYLATRGNIRRYTADRLDPGTLLATRAAALEGESFAPQPIPALTTQLQSDEPAMLVLHDDDAGGDARAFESSNVVSSAGIVAVDGRSPQAMAESVVSFAHDAIADGLTRAPSGDVAEIVSSRDPAAAAAALRRIARRHEVRSIVTPYAPVGPVRDAFAAIEPLLRLDGISIVYLARAFDGAVWPHATRGFFNLKDKIPNIFATLGIQETAL